MPAMLKANERCYKRTFGLYGLEALNHRSEFKILWDTFRGVDKTWPRPWPTLWPTAMAYPMAYRYGLPVVDFLKLVSALL